jgi:cardiolipin synthase A/B
MSYAPSSGSSSVYTIQNQVKLIRGGKAYFQILAQMIEGARDSIHFQTYIFQHDETGVAVGDSLIRAAKRGVKVYLLVDGYASQGLSREFLKKLKMGGIQFRWFEPIFRSRFFYFGRRMHHKIVLVDSQKSLVGGINVSNRYNDLPGNPAWLDYAIYAEGEVCGDIFSICINRWNRSWWGKRKFKKLDDATSVTPSSHHCLVRVRRNDWVRSKNQISRSYLEMFKKAKDHIIIISSYFLPGFIFRRGLAQAASRGVKIDVIVAGKSDVPLAKNAERYIYRWMFKNNINIFEYQPNILHAKISCYDGVWVTIGSYNVNNISAYASIELNLDVLDKEFASRVEAEMNEIKEKNCLPLTRDKYSTRFPIWVRFWQSLSYELVRLIFFLFTFYFKQRKG